MTEGHHPPRGGGLARGLAGFVAGAFLGAVLGVVTAAAYASPGDPENLLADERSMTAFTAGVSWGAIGGGLIGLILGAIGAGVRGFLVAGAGPTLALAASWFTREALGEDSFLRALQFCLVGAVIGLIAALVLHAYFNPDRV